MQAADLLTIGQVADRTGLAVSAVRFYADEGLVEAHRTSAGHRMFRRAEIRRLSFILIAQKLGYTLGEIGEQLAELPTGRTPTERDWERLGKRFSTDLTERIDQLAELRDKLSACIGCGCLSLERCQLYNPEDRIASRGVGPRYLLGDRIDD